MEACERMWRVRFFRSAKPRVCSAGLALAVVNVLGTPARAQDQQPVPGTALETTELAYQAPLGCPDAETFRALVAEKRATPPSAKPPKVQVAVQQDASGYVATMVLHSSENSVSRQVSGEVCDEVASAIALITALALDAHIARVLKLESDAPEPPPPTKRPPTPSPAPAPHRSQRVEASSSQLNAGLALQFDADTAPSPELSLGASAQALLGVNDWEQEYRVGVGYRSSDLRGYPVDSEPKFPFRVSLIAARLDACPWALRATRAFTFRPCAAVEVGRFRAKATAQQVSGAGDGPNGSSQLWGALFAAPRVELRATSALSLEVSPQLQVPLNRHTEIQIDTDPRPGISRRTVVHKPEMIEFLVSAGLRLNIW